MESFLVGVAHAQDGGGGAAASGQGFQSTLFVLIAFFAIFYFLIIRPQQRRQKETKKMLTALKRGDRVLTSGGIFGTVWDVKEDLIVLKLSEELKVEVTKSAVQAVVNQ